MALLIMYVSAPVKLYNNARKNQLARDLLGNFLDFWNKENCLVSQECQPLWGIYIVDVLLYVTWTA